MVNTNRIASSFSDLPEVKNLLTNSRNGVNISTVSPWFLSHPHGPHVGLLLGDDRISLKIGRETCDKPCDFGWVSHVLNHKCSEKTTFMIAPNTTRYKGGISNTLVPIRSYHWPMGATITSSENSHGSLHHRRVQCSSRWCPGHFLAENCWNVRQKWLVSTKPYGSSHMDHRCYPHSCSWLTFETHRPDAKGVVFLLDVSYFVYFVSSSVDDPNCVCLKMGSHTVIPSKLYIIWHNVTVIYPLVIKPGVLVTPHRTALPRVA